MRRHQLQHSRRLPLAGEFFGLLFVPEFAKSEENLRLRDVNVVEGRLQDIPSAYDGAFSLILCNPPYERGGYDNLSYEKAICRKEITITLDEIAAHPACDYLFLSPLFDSISKSGYRAAFTDGELRDAAARGLLGERVVALGGIRPELLPRVRELGFGGAALLGAVWRDASPAALHRTMERIRRFNI